MNRPPSSGASSGTAAAADPPPGLFERYDPNGFYCELTAPRADAGTLGMVRERLDRLGLPELRRRARRVDRAFYDRGVTFTVYSDAAAIDRTLPFDVVPRVVTAQEWAVLEAGIVQRVQALNAFLGDVYGPQHVLKDGTVPPDLVLGNAAWRPEMQHRRVPRGVYAHICGIDLVRDTEGRFLVLEDNARTPSGVSYVVENRAMMQRAFPDLMSELPIRPVHDYGARLAEALAELAPDAVLDPQIVLLSPGIYNSAYFEHVFLAREMGVPLVEDADLTVEADDRVYMRTTAGLAPVDVIYRRLNDDFLDPDVFRPDSLLGVRGLMRAWAKGHVALANAVGTGVADDKALYAYMPRLIRYYLGQDPILPNVETHICREPDALAYTLDNLEHLVVKPVAESGGYGLIVGPRASRRALAAFRERLKAQPQTYISQPMVGLSVCPTVTPSGLAARHVDLRPFAVTGRRTWVLPGGLTRVALKAGSIVVNSSQGGGSKDTWVLAAA